MNSMSMSSAIQKLIPLEEGQNLADYNKINATKVCILCMHCEGDDYGYR